jgi:hypothetical protein
VGGVLGALIYRYIGTPEGLSGALPNKPANKPGR